LYEVQVSDVDERTETSVEVGRRAAQRAESRMLIDGELVAAASGAEFDNVSPATGLVLGSTAAADAEDMQRAIAAARRAFDETDWSTIADGVDELGRLDIVVANAGICAMGEGQTIQSWSDTIDTDLVGVFNVIQASLPHVNDGASIIATGSLAAQLGSATNQGPGGSAYSLAKQMVARYVNDLSVQLAKRMIRVNAVHPTNVNTDMLHNEGMYKVFRPDMESPTREDAEASFPAMQAMPVPYIEPQDVSNTVVFLASDDSRYITGTQLRVDAGGFVKAKPWKG
jgi:NAD(P)-dependent dehydrogenase (short-subunit alcohol dehydrogenase family)